jgi:TPR repeat protein
MARFDFSAQDVADVSAQGGGADALFELGLMYCSGRDVDLDFIQAHKWFNLAALRGNEQAKQYRLDLSREMTKKEIAAAQKSAREWLRLH